MWQLHSTSALQCIIVYCGTILVQQITERGAAIYITIIMVKVANWPILIPEQRSFGLLAMFVCTIIFQQREISVIKGKLCENWACYLLKCKRKKEGNKRRLSGQMHLYTKAGG